METVETKLEKNFFFNVFYKFFESEGLKQFEPTTVNCSAVEELTRICWIFTLEKTHPYSYSCRPTTEVGKEWEDWKDHLQSYAWQLKTNLGDNIFEMFCLPDIIRENFEFSLHNTETVFNFLAEFYDKNGRPLASKDPVFETIVKLTASNVVNGLLQNKERKKREKVQEVQNAERLKSLTREVEYKRMKEMQERYEAQINRYREELKAYKPPYTPWSTKYVSTVDDDFDPWDPRDNKTESPEERRQRKMKAFFGSQHEPSGPFI